MVPLELPGGSGGEGPLWVAAWHCELLGYASASASASAPASAPAPASASASASAAGSAGGGGQGGQGEVGGAPAPPQRLPEGWRPFRPWHGLRPGDPPNHLLLAALRNAAVEAARGRPGLSEADLAARLGPHLVAPAAARELLDALVACGELRRTEPARGGDGDPPPWCSRAVARPGPPRYHAACYI